jgi:hypothetical protein
MTATGIGIEDGKAPALISFVFTDFGEPGKKDTASYTITGPFPLFATGFLNQGNHQAHLF